MSKLMLAKRQPALEFSGLYSAISRYAKKMRVPYLEGEGDLVARLIPLTLPVRTLGIPGGYKGIDCMDSRLEILQRELFR